ncbi:MAG: 4Fe-4S binding protein [Spirochaetes bacterium]|nr:4Fe-4S binding protein [Spirochaetota bacterium]MBN2772143.1 4Fe-4S binding protein [Spirochaetota bacterium]
MIHISKRRCVGCGICNSECPVGALVVDTDKGYAVIDNSKCLSCGVCIARCPQRAIADITKSIVFAIGTDDGTFIKQKDHVGSSLSFMIYRYSEGKMVLIDKRNNVKYDEDESETHGDPGKAAAVSDVLSGADVIVGSIIGPNVKRLRKQFLPIVVRTDTIENSLKIITENMPDISEELSKENMNALVLS